MGSATQKTQRNNIMSNNVKRNRSVILAATAVVITAVAALGLTVFRPKLGQAVRAVSNAVSELKYRKYSHYRDSDGKLIIRLDPGHGGSDPGATSEFLGDVTESDINYRLAHLVGERLEQYGAVVIYTWDENTEPSENGDYPYQKRSEEANADPETDLYISIHCNSFTDPSVSGSRIYFCPEVSPYSHGLAKAISDGVGSVHDFAPRLYSMKYEEAFWVIRKTNAPSVLIETLFVSNKEDAERLLDDDWLSKEAEGIAAGIWSFAA